MSKSRWRRRLRRLRLADRPPLLAVPGLGDQNLPDRPAPNPVDRIPHHVGTSALSPHLQPLARAFHRLRHQPPFADVMAAGLFHVNMLTRVQSQDRRRSMPVVGRCDPDRLDPVVVEHAPEVRSPLRPLVRALLHDRDAIRQPVPVHVTNVGDLDIFPLGQMTQMVAPHPPRADQPDGHPALGRPSCRHASERQGRCSQGALLKNRPASDRSHRRVLSVERETGQDPAMIAPSPGPGKGSVPRHRRVSISPPLSTRHASRSTASTSRLGLLGRSRLLTTLVGSNAKE